MPTYCVDKHDPPPVQGRLIHNTDAGLDCLPASYFQLPLGWHPDVASALREAHEFYKDAHPCSCC